MPGGGEVHGHVRAAEDETVRGRLCLVRVAAEVPRQSSSKRIWLRTTRTILTRRCRSVTLSPATGMKSTTSPTPSALRKRVTRIGVHGR